MQKRLFDCDTYMEERKDLEESVECTLNNTYKCAHINGPISSYLKVRSF